jgi:hypothetical protein
MNQSETILKDNTAGTIDPDPKSDPIPASDLPPLHRFLAYPPFMDMATIAVDFSLITMLMGCLLFLPLIPTILIFIMVTIGSTFIVYHVGKYRVLSTTGGKHYMNIALKHGGYREVIGSFEITGVDVHQDSGGWKVYSELFKAGYCIIIPNEENMKMNNFFLIAEFKQRANNVSGYNLPVSMACLLGTSRGFTTIEKKYREVPVLIIEQNTEDD